MSFLGSAEVNMTMVVCFRCLNGYDIETVETMRTKRLSIKEPACPKCKCKLYFNRTDSWPLNVSFKRGAFTAMEDG